MDANARSVILPNQFGYIALINDNVYDRYRTPSKSKENGDQETF